MEIRVGWRERTRLKNVAKEVFARLIMDRESGRVNELQDGFLLSAILGALIVFAGAALWGLMESGLVASAAVATGAEETSVVIGFGLAVIVIFAILVAVVRGAISSRSYNLVGWTMIALRRLNPGSEAAQSNIADVKYWLRTDPARIRTEIAEFYCKSCAEVLPRRLSGALRDLADETLPGGFLVVHGLLERKYWPLYALSGWRTPRPDEQKGGDRAHYFILARALRNAIKIAVCFDALDVELRDEAANGTRWWWDYYTKADYQHVPLWDEHDMPLRMRSASPHLRWPDDKAPSSDGEIPLFRAFTGLENPMGFPIRLIEIRHVVENMPAVAGAFFDDCKGDGPEIEALRRRRAARALCLLANRPVKMIGRQDYQTLLPVMGRDATDRPLLARLDGGSANLQEHDVDDVLAADWGARWDPSRVAWSELKPASDAELMQAIAMFNDAVNNTMRARRHDIVLKRGSVVFIDNRRCLVSRFERQVTARVAFKRLFLGQPAEWWLRRFYGFRKTRHGDRSGRDTSERFDARSD